ncbi:MAG: hypothetical protein V2B18_19795 [Pseudomonadota bacterium]
MEPTTPLLKRLSDLQERLARLEPEPADSSRLSNVRDLLTQAEELHRSCLCPDESNGCAAHPLGSRPFITAKILFALDRAEDLLNGLLDPEPRPAESRAVNPVDLLYPSIGEAMLQRFFCFVSRLRGRLLGYRVDCRGPYVREYLYLKSPIILSPLFRRLLPSRRHPGPVKSPYEETRSTPEKTSACGSADRS